jgi:restriction endonuclease S subunit
MSEFSLKNYMLGDLVEVAQGLAINAKSKYMLAENGLPLLRITDLINDKQVQFINPEFAPPKCIAYENDIIYTRTGQVGLVFKGRTGVIHNNCFKVIPSLELIDSDYLFWFLSQTKVKRYVNDVAAGSVQKDLNHSAFKSISIDLPPIEYQRTVGPILNSLTKKIELNRQINQTLEAMAQAIFQSWFVDFDPVKAKIVAREQWQILTDDQLTEWLNELLNTQEYFKTCLLELTAKAGLSDDESLQLKSSLDLIYCRGYGPEGSENLDIGLNNLRKEWQSKIAGPALQSASETLYLNIAAMTAISSRNETSLIDMPADEFAQLYKTASLFPERLVESELGEIPEGWDVRPLSHQIELIGGGTPKRSEEEFWNGDIPWFSVKDVPSDGNVFVIETEERITEIGLKKSSTKILKEGTTIVTARGTVGKLALVGVDMCMNQSCYGVVGINTGPYFNYFNLQGAVETLKRNTHGAVFDTITTKTFDTYKSSCGPTYISDEFESLVTPLMKNIKNNLFQISTLSNLRDSLLPKLLSGELEIQSND